MNCRIQWTDAMVKILLAEIQIHAESFTSPLSKQTWKNIAVSINTHGYNLTADNCYIKWTGMKKKYKMIKDANNQTGAAKQTWEYFDIVNGMLRKNPEIEPLSIASNIRGFQINQGASSSTSRNEKTEKNQENEPNIQSSINVFKNRPIRARKPRISSLTANIIEQRERHHKENYKQRERLLSLLERHLTQNK